MRFPDGPAPALPDRFRGRPHLDFTRCGGSSADASGAPPVCETSCRKACPTEALIFERDRLQAIDLGRCLFCAQCLDSCPRGAIDFTRECRLATGSRADLLFRQDETFRLAEAARAEILRLFGRSLKLRQVSAGGCNACEADLNVLGTIGWDLSRFGIQMVASPRHADGLIVTGCVTENMRLALEQTYEAIPAPKIVIAVGACAIGGGPFFQNEEQNCGADSLLPVDLYIPGCPPHPLTILDGLLRFLGRVS